jgi:hypothetical protein
MVLFASLGGDFMVVVLLVAFVGGFLKGFARARKGG